METNPIWAEIDVEALQHNYRVARELAGPETKVMAVVKADGYGHGAVTVARALAVAGADTLGVARLSEAVALREAGLTLPILIFGYTPPAAAETLIRYDLAQTVFSLSYAAALNDAARSGGGRIAVHIKIDTGMGRLGLVAGNNGVAKGEPEPPGGEGGFAKWRPPSDGGGRPGRRGPAGGGLRIRRG